MEVSVWLLVQGVPCLAGPLVDAVEVDVGNHSIAMPFGHLARVAPLHPVIGVAAEHAWVGGGGFTLAQQVRVGALGQGFLGTSATLGTELQARLTASAGPTAELGLGVGGVVTWRVRPGLAWSEEEHTYVPRADPGRPGLTAGLDLGLGFDLERVADLPLTPMVRYRWFAQTPFLPALPLGPQGVVSVGVRWDLGGAR